MGSIPVLNTMLNLNLAGRLAAASAPASSDYRALVCLFFGGGIDSYNLLVPRSNTHYGIYKTARDNLALDQNTLVALNPLNDPGSAGGIQSGLQLGLHSSLPNLGSMFENGGTGLNGTTLGGAAFIANVGTSLGNVTIDQFNNGGGTFPVGLFSHSDQSEQWQTSTSDLRSSRGWAGRAGDILRSLNDPQTVSMNISLSGGNVWQSGEQVFAYSVGPDGATSLDGYDSDNHDLTDITGIRTRAVDRQLALTYQHLLTQEFASRKLSAMDTYKIFNKAIVDAEGLLPGNVNFNTDNNYLGHQLQLVAKAIASHQEMGHVRQTFFVEIDGWDMHSKLTSGLVAQLPPVDEAIMAFYNCLKGLGMDSNVTVFTASDFARTLTSNGDGTDHAWGSNQFVFGGAVKGKNIYGHYPDLTLNTDDNPNNNPLDVGRGRFIPTTPVDLYYAELALWLGVSKSDLATVLPNIGRWYDPASSGSPMGFLA